MPNLDPIAILQDIAAKDPLEPTTFGHGSYGTRCIFCGDSTYASPVITHKPDCVWLRAKVATP